MFILDMPDVPSQYAPVMIAQASQEQQGAAKSERTVGVCQALSNPAFDGAVATAENSLTPAGDVINYFYSFENRKVTGPSTVTVLAYPKHGNLEDLGTVVYDESGRAIRDTGERSYSYIPETGYLGQDSATLLVEIGGYKVKIVYVFKVAMEVDYKKAELLCAKSYWKISAVLDANGGGKITAVDFQSPMSGGIGSSATDTTALATEFGSGFLGTAATSGISFNVADLPNGALGQTTNRYVTLATDAAEYGWFIDSTPADNSEFLPTSNPNEWVAKADSEAAGKIDMLSVLLHEYGHALGIEHSADSGDYMASTLQPGVRRLPSTEELALMAQLVGEIKSGSNGAPDTPQSPSLPIGTTLSALLIGRLRRTAYGSWSPVFDSVQVPAPVVRFEIASNPTLTDPKLQTGTGWETQGNVSIGNGAAILSETSTSQTRLNQVFIVGEHDRYLSFTVAGIGLDAPKEVPLGDDQANGPDDAFEVGLLDGNSGASLAGTIGLTHSDALLNLQADGSEFVGQGITSTANADGSRTYRIDLSGIDAGTAVNLSFDLIGFGPATSHVTVRDIRIGIPEAHDDSVATSEDTPLAILELPAATMRATEA
ncbi:MAG: matrixin family metalloprotease [Sterolibacterium sp.]